MPEKRKTRKPRRKRAKAKTAVDKKQTKQISLLKKIILPNETRYTDFPFGAVNIPGVSGSPAPEYMFNTVAYPIVPGTDQWNTRVGNSVFLKHMHLSYNVYNAADTNAYYRIMVIWSHDQIYGADMDELLRANNTVVTGVNLWNSPNKPHSKMRILYDRTINLGGLSSGGTNNYNGYPEYRNVKHNIRLKNLKVTFTNGTNAIENGWLGVWWASNTTSLYRTGTCKFTYSA